MLAYLLSAVLSSTMTNTLLWDLPGDVLAAPASALCGWNGVILLFLREKYYTYPAPQGCCALF